MTDDVPITSTTLSTRPPQDTQDAQPVQDTLDTQLVQDTLDTLLVQDTPDTQPVQDTLDTQPVQDTPTTRDIPNAQDTLDTPPTHDGIAAMNSTSRDEVRLQRGEESERSTSCDSITLEEIHLASGPVIRVIPPNALCLISPGTANASNARKSPVTVQEWVDSLPPPCLREGKSPPEQWPPARPEGVGLKREASIQSDAGSHCSSVESLLGSRRADPEEVLLGLGFGGGSNDLDSDVARIPRRFLRPSKVKGVAIHDFLRHQHDLVQTFESGFFGYRGLTGPGYRPPSVIVAKIMEKLRGVRPSMSPPATPGKRFSRIARKVMNANILPSSVLTPDNRQFLDDQGGKSPEVPRKRMIIGHRSFTFDHDGHLIEFCPSGDSSSSSEEAVNPINILSASLSLTSSDNDVDDLFLIDSLTNLTPFKPSMSTSSRSISLDSTDSPSITNQTCEMPLQRFQRYSSTSVSSWESSSPHQGAVVNSTPRRRSLKRQQRVDEDDVVSITKSQLDDLEIGDDGLDSIQASAIQRREMLRNQSDSSGFVDQDLATVGPLCLQQGGRLMSDINHELRELVSSELRRLANLLDEKPSDSSVPTMLVQLTSLLRSNSELLPTCQEILHLVRENHDHLLCLIESNNRELDDIHRLLNELVRSSNSAGNLCS